MKSREIRVIYGKDIAAMTRRLIEDYDLASKIGDVNAKIALKPNLVVATTPDTGATTHVEIITEVIEYLQEKGFRDISIMEGSWVGDDTERAFRVNGYNNISKKYGVKLFDLKKDKYDMCHEEPKRNSQRQIQEIIPPKGPDAPHSSP